MTPTELAWVERCLDMMDHGPLHTYTPPTLCRDCEQEGRNIASVRPVANHGYCAAHLANLYATFSQEAWIDGGVGLQDGPMRPEYGPLEADLRCCCCDATWTGIPGDPCWHCQRMREIQVEQQARLVLNPPDSDPDDETYEVRMRAWAQRLAVAVQANIITERQAHNATAGIDRRTA